MDKETVIKGLENWVNNHKGENFLLTYSSVVELLALLKEQEHKDRMFHALEDDWKRLKELLKEQEAIKPNTEEPIWCPMKNIEEASININNQNPVIALKAAIVCTNTQDEYSAGFRNGVRYAISILTGDEPKYENVT